MKPKTEKDKNQNIRVSVRCRPINAIEKKQGSFSVLECNADKKEVTVKERLGVNPTTKSFSFDHVFPPGSQQMDVYKSVVTPIIDEVLSGYNCTVFAYGQTSTGKTYTMEGERTADLSVSWEEDPLAGIIPRAMKHIFEKLGKQEVEFSVRVSFLELYNEELFDLLGSGDDTLKLKIYEDNTKKGSVIINGLEEVVVRNKHEVFEILERGTSRRQTAATLMNATSSRSHTVFSVTIHIKESNIEGEELLKTGKLYLVDLAGSENIGRSGAVDKRAREAGNINQSLLTLGRVITSLVEHAPHIPYRESKLTRLLQDSLGGRTKTSIIATISPAACNLDETLSTLDYAHRAKNITNRPEINQKLTKKTLIREYTEEIERLRRDLQAVREKNGIYLAEENYLAMQSKIAQQFDTIKDMEENIGALTTEREKLTKLYTETEEKLEETTKNLTVTTENLITTTENLHETKCELKVTVQDRDEQKFLVKTHVSTETCLFGEAKELRETVDCALSDIHGLHSKLDRKKEVERNNEECQQQFGNRVQGQITQMKDSVSNFLASQSQIHSDLIDKTVCLTKRHCDQLETAREAIRDYQRTVTDQVGVIRQHGIDQTDQHMAWLDSVQQLTSRTQTQETTALTEFQGDVFQPAVRQATDSLALATTILQRQMDLLQAQKTEQEQLLSQYMCTSTANLENLTSLVDSHVADVVEGLASMEEQATEEDNLENKLEEFIKEHLQTRRQLIKQTRERKRCKQQAVETFHETLACKVQKLQGVSKETETELLGIVTSNCTHNQTDLSQVLTEVNSCTGTCDDIKQKVTASINQRQRVWAEHQATITERTQEHSGAIQTSHSHHSTLTQDLTTESEKSGDSLVSQLKDDEQRWLTDTKDSQTHMKVQMQNTSEWSNNMSADLQEHTVDVEKFLSDELRKDVPTGKTPQRRMFTYPLQLTHTAEHDLLLDDFRATYKDDPLVTNLTGSLDAVAETGVASNTSESEGLERAPSEAGSDKSHSSCTSGVSSFSHMSMASSKVSSKENKQRKAKTKQANVNTTPRGKSRLPLKAHNPTEA